MTSVQCVPKKDQRYFLRSFNKFARIAIIFGNRHCTGKLQWNECPPQLISVAILYLANWKGRYITTAKRQNGQYARIGLQIAHNCSCRQRLQQKSLAVIVQWRVRDNAQNVHGWPWRTLTGDDATDE